MTAKQIEVAALKLPSRDRRRIANRLLDTLEPKPDQAIPDDWAAEAERRNRELDEGTEVAIPYEKVMRELRASLRRR
jgi:putative addiction module component (TIGR02574 family)